MQRSLVLLFLLIGFCSNGQPINERYNLGETNTVFGSVSVLDSAYIIAGVAGNGTPFSWVGLLLKYDLNGVLIDSTVKSSDTIGFDFWVDIDLLPIPSNKLALLGMQATSNRPWSFRFMILDSSTNILLESEIYEITDNSNYRVIRCVDLLYHDEDSTFTGLLAITNSSDDRGSILVVNLSSGGVLNWHKIILAPNPNGFRILFPRGMIQKPNGNYIISSYTFNTFGLTEDQRSHIRIIELDNTGNIVTSFTDSSNPMDIGGEGLTLTQDGSIIFNRLRGYWDPQANGWRYYAQIVCLDSLLSEMWTLAVGGYGDPNGTTVNEILPVGSQEYVAVGSYLDTPVVKQPSTLLKFNDQGEKIWQKFYQKVPKIQSSGVPKHILYDVAQTADSGFVMVGEARNTNNPNHEMGQLGWLVKTDKHGCLVPGCEQFANVDTTLVDTTDNTDSIINPEPPKPSPNTLIYPNPAQNELNVYYATTVLSPSATAYLFNTNGQIVNKWPITTNYTTYIVDVSVFAKGVYVLKIVDGESETIQKVVVE